MDAQLIKNFASGLVNYAVEVMATDSACKITYPICSELMANTNVCQTRYPIGQWIVIIIGLSYWSIV